MDYSNVKIPNHVAIIVDGNGRWAQKRGLSRSMGHKAGADNLETLSNYIFSKGIKVLSLFVFSTENFKRSKEEVDYLMNLIVKNFEKLKEKYKKKNIKVVFSGRRENLNHKVLETIDSISDLTKDNDGAIINFCLNYGGHTEIIDAVKKIHEDVNQKKLDLEKLDETTFQKYLYHNLPPIDLLIRTSGEMRVSNFMLWQLSYAEFYFPHIYFPDFDTKAFDDAIIEYTKRDRRFGGINYENKNH